MATTDFVLTFNNGINETEMAIAVKQSADLTSQRTLEKLEIERCYWSARNIPWQILTEKELPRAVVKNLRWAYPHVDLVQSGTFTDAEVVRIRSALEQDLEEGRQSLVEVTAACDDLEPPLAHRRGDLPDDVQANSVDRIPFVLFAVPHRVGSLEGVGLAVAVPPLDALVFAAGLGSLVGRLDLRIAKPLRQHAVVIGVSELVQREVCRTLIGEWVRVESLARPREALAGCNLHCTSPVPVSQPTRLARL